MAGSTGRNSLKSTVIEPQFAALHLAALVPGLGVNMTRCHGLFSPSAPGVIEGFLLVQILVWIHLFAIVHDLDVHMRAG
jgi:hypothetical protein